MGTTLAIIGGVVGAGSSIYGATQTGGGGGPAGADEIATSLGLEREYSPLGGVAALNALYGQNAYGIGAGGADLSLELLMRQLENSKNPSVAREFSHLYGELQRWIDTGGVSGRRIEGRINNLNAMLSRYTGGNVSIGYGADGVNIRFQDPATQQLVDRARADSTLIQGRRLSAQNQLSRLAADFPSYTATDLAGETSRIQSDLEREINAVYEQQFENLLQSANTRGFNPYGAIGELEKQRSRDLVAAPTTAADRALQILGGRQSLATGSISGINAALSPDSTISILNALRGQQTPTTGQLASAQIGASAQLAAANTAARQRAISDVGGSISDLGAILADAYPRNNPGPGTQG